MKTENANPGMDVPSPTDVMAGKTGDFVTATIHDQLFGIPVLAVQDVLGSQHLTRVPLAPPEVGGALNLRGRIVTAIDVRRRLGLEERQDNSPTMSIVVDHGGELYSLMVDAVGEVLTLSNDSFENAPATLDPVWKNVCKAVCRLDDGLLLILDVARLLDLNSKMAA